MYFINKIHLRTSYRVLTRFSSFLTKMLWRVDNRISRDHKDHKGRKVFLTQVNLSTTFVHNKERITILNLTISNKVYIMSYFAYCIYISSSRILTATAKPISCIKSTLPRLFCQLTSLFYHNSNLNLSH